MKNDSLPKNIDYPNLRVIVKWRRHLCILKISSIVVYKYGKLFRFILKDVLKEKKLWHASKAIQHSNVPLLNIGHFV